MKRSNIEECISWAKSKNGRCLTPIYTNSRTKMEWACEFNHTWFAAFHMIKQNHWCPTCAGVNKNTIDSGQRLADNFGGKCLQIKQVNGRSICEWKCNQNHSWWSRQDNVLEGHWCPKCSGVAKNNINDCIELAAGHDGYCLSTEYVNNTSDLCWQCKNKHIWFSSYNTVSSQKSWCPKCGSHKTQNKIIKIIEDFGFDVFPNQRKLNWLINPKTNRNLEIDILLPQQKIAIEYDGQQHFMPIRFSSISLEKAKINFEKQKKLDALKTALIADHIKNNGSDVKYFFRISYTEEITEDLIRERLRLCNILI